MATSSTDNSFFTKVANASPAYGTTSSSLNTTLTQKGMGTDTASINTLWTGAFGSTTPYTGTAAQNAALQHAIQTGYKTGVNNSVVTGSAIVKQNQNTAAALSAASTNAGGNPNNNPPPNTPPATPPPPSASSGTSAGTYQGQPISTNPNIASLQNSANSAIDQYQNDYSSQTAPVTTQYNQQLQVLQSQQANAVAAAADEYRRAGGVVGSTGEQNYVANVNSQYETQIQNAQDSYNETMAQYQSQLQDNILNVTSTTNQNIQAYQANAQSLADSEAVANPPEPITGNIDISTLQGAANVNSWIQDHEELAQNAFNSGNYAQYGNSITDPNVQLAIVQQYGMGSAAYTKEQSEEETAGAAVSRAGSAATSARAAVTNSQNNIQKTQLETWKAQHPTSTVQTKTGTITSAVLGSTTDTNKIDAQPIYIGTPGQGGQYYTVGQVVSNSAGHKGIINIDGTITPQ